MVALYFDYQFVELLNRRTDLNDPVIYDFINQFICKIRGVTVYVNLKSITELDEIISANKFWYYISEIAPIKLLDFKPMLENSKFYKKDALSKILFVEGCKEKYLQDTYSSIFVSNESLADKWRLFQSNREDSELLIKSNPSPDDDTVFKSWSDLNLFSHPVKNIVLFDFYIASDKSNQKIENNLIPLIQSLLKSNLAKANDLTIFTRELSGTKTIGTNVSWVLNDIARNIDKLMPLRKLVENIQFVNYDLAKVTTDPEHNRFLLTNYFLIRTEAGFNVFKNKKNLVNRRDNISFDSILNNRTRNLVDEILNNLKLYTSKINSEEKDYKGVTNYYYLSPLQSRFLKQNSLI